ncbi:hypothetical protein JXC34_04605 [Candidatus Woesearchaeota archaeon]|nr:hypothetical protein [Candidatus Woesearchaeota archaeon]
MKLELTDLVRSTEAEFRERVREQGYDEIAETSVIWTFNELVKKLHQHPRKNRMPYWTHVADTASKVMEPVDGFKADYTLVMGALLHDMVEEGTRKLRPEATGLAYEGLVVEMINLVTHWLLRKREYPVLLPGEPSSLRAFVERDLFAMQVGEDTGFFNARKKAVLDNYFAGLERLARIIPPGELHLRKRVSRQDFIKDNSITLGRIADLKNVLVLQDYMLQRKEECYFQYVDRIFRLRKDEVSNQRAMVIKLADTLSNTEDVDHIS